MNWTSVESDSSPSIQSSKKHISLLRALWRPDSKSGHARTFHTLSASLPHDLARQGSNFRIHGTHCDSPRPQLVAGSNSFAARSPDVFCWKYYGGRKDRKQEENPEGCSGKTQPDFLPVIQNIGLRWAGRRGRPRMPSTRPKKTACPQEIPNPIATTPGFLPLQRQEFHTAEFRITPRNRFNSLRLDPTNRVSGE